MPPATRPRHGTPLSRHSPAGAQGPGGHSEGSGCEPPLVGTCPRRRQGRLSWGGWPPLAGTGFLGTSHPRGGDRPGCGPRRRGLWSHLPHRAGQGLHDLLVCRGHHALPVDLDDAVADADAPSLRDAPSHEAADLSRHTSGQRTGQLRPLGARSCAPDGRSPRPKLPVQPAGSRAVGLWHGRVHAARRVGECSLLCRAAGVAGHR